MIYDLSVCAIHDSLKENNTTNLCEGLKVVFRV